MASSITGANISIRYIGRNYGVGMGLEEAVALGGLFVAFPGAVAVLWWVQAMAGTVPADALDRQPPARRASAAPVIEVARGCGLLARVGELHWSADGARFTFRCDLTILGWPAIHGRAECIDGQWQVSGWREVLGVGSCPAGVAPGRGR